MKPETTDTELLDWLTKQSEGMKWIARQSKTGRGYRLHTDRYAGAYDTPREALLAAMQEQPDGEKAA